MIPFEVRQRLLDRTNTTSVTALTPGMSGANLFRCEGDETQVLRCWPTGTAPQRVREIHSVISAAAIACPLIPQYRTSASDQNSWVIDSSGRIWDLATWMPGQPLAYDAALESIQTGARAIAEVHSAFQRSGSWQKPAQAITERVDRLQWLNRNLPPCFDMQVDGRVHPSVAIQVSAAQSLLRARWPLTARRIASALSPWCHRNLSNHYVLRDIHREHVLFCRPADCLTAGCVSGIIDFDAVRIDTPAVDLARWATSFNEYRKNPQQTIDCVLAGYCDVATLSQRPLNQKPSDAATAEFRTLVLAIAESSLWISLANWVIWLMDESRQFPDFQRVAERLSRLIESIDATANR